MIKKQNKKLTLLAIGIFLFIISSHYSHLWAQAPIYNAPSYDLTISPPTTYWHVKPGEVVQHQIKVKNQGKFTLQVSPQLVDFESNNSSGQPIIKKDSAFSYLYFTDSQYKWNQPFILKPGEEKTILMKIGVPNDAVEKEYYLTVLFKSAQVFEESTAATNAQISGTIGSNLIIFISTQETNQGKVILENIDIPKVIDSFRSIKFQVLGKNIGKNATAIEGNITVIQSGKILTEYLLYPDMVLSKTTRKARGISIDEIDNVKELIEKQDESVFKLLTDKFSYQSPFLLGIYTVSVTIGGETKTENILALPIALIAAVILAPLLWLLYRFLNTKMNNDLEVKINKK